VSTDGSGNATIAATLTASVTEGEYISATATNLTTNDTSEFARNTVSHIARIIITPDAELSTNEDGGAVEFSIVLNAAPVSEVTIQIASSDPGEGAASAASLTFTSANWNVAQTVTVTGVFDYLTDGNVPYTITFNPRLCGDEFYSALDVEEIGMVNIDHVNCAPVLTVPEKQTVNSSLLLSSTTENAVMVQDVDSGGNPLQMQLIATNGIMTLGNKAGLTFLVGDGTRDGTLQFSGSAADINAALEGMIFIPTDVNANLQIFVSDQGYSGSGGVLTATANLEIEAINPQPATLAPPILPLSSQSSSEASAHAMPLSASLSLGADAYLAGFSQDGASPRAETPFAENANPHGFNTLAHQAAPAEITSVAVCPDNAFLHDKYQILAEPIVLKPADDKLVMQPLMLDTQLLWKEINLAASDALPWLSKISVGTAIGLGAGLSAGYMMMAFRFGAMLTSSLATFPMWQWIDPLPILETLGGKPGKFNLPGESELDANAPLDESLETLIS
jgi:hypothetical protein